LQVAYIEIKQDKSYLCDIENGILDAIVSLLLLISCRLDVDKVSSKRPFGLAVSWRVNGPAKSSNILLYAHRWVIGAR
jgi:hypothetical protein